jgi:hypothetical protein
VDPAIAFMTFLGLLGAAAKGGEAGPPGPPGPPGTGPAPGPAPKPAPGPKPAPAPGVPAVPPTPAPAPMPPWPAPVVPTGLPPFPGPGWVADTPVSPAVTARATFWNPQLWDFPTKRIVKPFVIEQFGGRWLAFRAAWHPGAQGPQTFMATEAYRLASAAPVQPSPVTPAPVIAPSTLVAAAQAALAALHADPNYRVSVGVVGSPVNTAVHNFKTAYNAANPGAPVPINTGLYETVVAAALSQVLSGAAVPPGYDAASPGTAKGNAYPPATAPAVTPLPVTLTPTQIQHDLNLLGVVTPPLVEDGNLGAVLSASDVQKALAGTLGNVHLSRQAVVKFQQQNGLRVDSDPGPQTQSMLASQVTAAGLG